MKAFTFLALMLLASCPSAHAQDGEIDIPIISDIARLFKGPYELVVCMYEGNLNVRSDDLRRVVFTVANYEPLKVFQGWGDNKKTKTINGEEYTFVKVQFPRREARGQKSDGWVAESLIKARSECDGAPQGRPLDPPEEPQKPAKPAKPTKPSEPAKPTKPSEPVKPAKPAKPTKPSEDPGDSPGSNEQIRGLNDDACCEFPTKGDVTEDFASGMRRFGAGRSGGDRLHAACDLYRYLGEPISAVAPGVVIRGKYEFYQGTYAIEVRHSGGFVVRYGEVTGKNAANASTGEKIKMGQIVAYMGKVNSNCCEPMLHFELYSGSANGSLTGGGPYQRRSDLLNPTNYLRKWQENKFRNRK